MKDGDQYQQEEEIRNGIVNFYEALSGEVHFTSKVSLNAAENDADDEAENPDAQGVDHGIAESVYEPGGDIATSVVGSQDIFPGRRRGVFFHEFIDGEGAPRDGGKEHPRILMVALELLVVHMEGPFVAEFFGVVIEKDGKI